MNRFLRTAPTRRLLGAVLGVIVVAAAGATIALAAIGSGPVPRRESLARAIHQGLSAPAPNGISARIKFTDNLIGASELQGSDPLLSGGSGRLWLSGQHLRLEVQGSNGDGQVVVNGSSFWAYDPAANTVFEGTLPTPHKSAAGDQHDSAIPSIAQIQGALNRLAQHLQLSGAIPGDVAGQPAYSVRVSPAHNDSLLGAIQLAWDAARRVPLSIGLYARGDSTPVLALSATDISFGPQSPSVFAIRPPASAKVVRLSGSSKPAAGATLSAAHQVAIPVDAPRTLAGRSRQSIHDFGSSDRPGVLIVYGRGLGAIVVLEQYAPGAAGASFHLPQGGDGAPHLTLPTVSINGSTAQQLVTAIGTVVRFTRSGVTYTVLGSVTAATADAAARGL